MKLELTVQLKGEYWRGGAMVEIPELLVESFQPMRTTDIPEMTYIAGELIAGSEKSMKVLKLREDAAKILSEHLTRMILDEMSKKDTHNGY